MRERRERRGREREKRERRERGGVGTFFKNDLLGLRFEKPSLDSRRHILSPFKKSALKLSLAA